MKPPKAIDNALADRLNQIRFIHHTDMTDLDRHVFTLWLNIGGILVFHSDTRIWRILFHKS